MKKSRISKLIFSSKIYLKKKNFFFPNWVGKSSNFEKKFSDFPGNRTENARNRGQKNSSIDSTSAKRRRCQRGEEKREDASTERRDSEGGDWPAACRRSYRRGGWIGPPWILAAIKINTEAQSEGQRSTAEIQSTVNEEAT